MKKFLFTMICFLFVAEAFSQTRQIEAKEDMLNNPVYSGMDDEACLLIVCDSVYDLSFFSTMDKEIKIAKTEYEGTNKLYYLIFKASKRYRGRQLRIACPGKGYLILDDEKIHLQPKQIRRFRIYDPDDEVDAGCYRMHRMRGDKYFTESHYNEAKAEYEISKECSDADSTEAASKVALCDSMNIWLQRASDGYQNRLYVTALQNYNKVLNYNSNDHLSNGRYEECTKLISAECDQLYSAAETYRKKKYYSEARVFYQKMVDENCPLTDLAQARIREISSLQSSRKEKAQVLTYEYNTKTPFGISYGSYGTGTRGFFTLGFNQPIFDLMRGDYKYGKKPEVDMSFGWTFKVVPKYGWLFFGPGVTALANYEYDRDKIKNFFNKQSVSVTGLDDWTDDEINKKFEAATAENTTIKKKDYLEAKYKFAISPVVGCVIKIGPVALRYTFQYRFTMKSSDESVVGKTSHSFGLGFVF